MGESIKHEHCLGRLTPLENLHSILRILPKHLGVHTHIFLYALLYTHSLYSVYTISTLDINVKNRVKIFYLYNVKIALPTPSLPSIFTDQFHLRTLMTVTKDIGVGKLMKTSTYHCKCFYVIYRSNYSSL